MKSLTNLTVAFAASFIQKSSNNISKFKIHLEIDLPYFKQCFNYEFTAIGTGPLLYCRLLTSKTNYVC